MSCGRSSSSKMGIPSGYRVPARDAGYLRPMIPGICVAVNATTSYASSSRKTTLKLWKSRPAAPRRITLARPGAAPPRNPIPENRGFAYTLPSPPDHALNIFLGMAARALVPHPEGRAGPGGVATGDGPETDRGLPAEVEAARGQGAPRRGGVPGRRGASPKARDRLEMVRAGHPHARDGAGEGEHQRPRVRRAARSPAEHDRLRRHRHARLPMRDVRVLDGAPAPRARAVHLREAMRWRRSTTRASSCGRAGGRSSSTHAGTPPGPS